MTFGMAKFGAEKIGPQFSNPSAQFGAEMSDLTTNTDRECCPQAFGWVLYFMRHGTTQVQQFCTEPEVNGWRWTVC